MLGARLKLHSIPCQYDTLTTTDELPSKLGLKRWHVSNGTCFLWAMIEKDVKHIFLTCMPNGLNFTIMS